MQSAGPFTLAGAKTRQGIPGADIQVEFNCETLKIAAICQALLKTLKFLTTRCTDITIRELDKN